MMEKWNTGILGLLCNELKNVMIDLSTFLSGSSYAFLPLFHVDGIKTVTVKS
jgi:hypothetical protein